MFIVLPHEIEVKCQPVHRNLEIKWLRRRYSGQKKHGRFSYVERNNYISSYAKYLKTKKANWNQQRLDIQDQLFAVFASTFSVILTCEARQYWSWSTIHKKGSELGAECQAPVKSLGHGQQHPCTGSKHWALVAIAFWVTAV